MVSASVGSWKTEELGFEVSGRVEYVVEPNTEVEGRILDKQGNRITEGTPIAQLESERYSLQVAKAEADVVRAEQNLLASQTELNENLPAQVAAATASRNLAKTEFERSERLYAQNAGSLGDVDRDRANYDSAEAQLKQLAASTKAKKAEIESLKNAKLQAQQNLRDAQRNLEDCTLYSSFRGQIAEISVVPGSVVSAGQAVATLQMMDPIKVELEVSAEVSRQLEQRERLPVVVTMPDGSQETHEGYLYLIDPIADPLTRTFTVTLLVINERLTSAEVDGGVAMTNDIWRLDFKFLPGSGENKLFVEEKALLKDADGYYLWMITNLTTQMGRSPSDRNLKVRKIRVTPGDLKIPYLGNWVFQSVVVDDEEFDASVNMVVGELKVREGEASQWNGDTVARMTEGRWMLRPGDLVRVDLGGRSETNGYYVPMDAITRKEGQPFVFIVEQSDGQSVARRIPIELTAEGSAAMTSSLRRVEPMESGRLEGAKLVIKGAHYLIDGEAVNPQQSEQQR
ncbi:MAG: HlyD family efflux transporter periplasmic adaptor subunit [Aureliella sp.]